MAKNFKAWPPGWPRSLNYPEIPVYSLLNQTAARKPNRIAIYFGGMELTYQELKTLSERFASALQEQGVAKGQKVALHLINCPQFAIAYFAVMKLGATFTPLSPMLSPREALHQLNDSEAETLISLDLIYPGIQGIVGDTGIKRVITTSIADCYNPVIQPLKPLGKIEVPDTLDMAKMIADHEPLEKDVEVDPKTDLAHIAYTGGTTGVSKGVMLTHFNVVTNVLQYSHWFTGHQVEFKDGMIEPVLGEGMSEDDAPLPRDKSTALVVVPWFHAMGTVGYLNNLVYSGSSMVVYPRFDPLEYISGVAKYNANMIGGAPQLFIPLVNLPEFKKLDLSGIKVCVSGAAPLALPVLEKMLDSFSGTICEAYGMTECAMGATANPPHRDNIRVGSVGLPVFDTEMKVIDLTTGEDLPAGQEGELCIRGPQVMQGYYNRPEATAEVLIGDGWLATGDIGKQDDDGFFYITDRKKDMIIYKGYNVYPRELEEVIFEHPAVQQCAVVGKNDPDVGEYPVAFIEFKAGQSATAEDIMSHTNTQVAPYKKVREVHILEAIPVSAAGKVLRKELRSKL